MTAQWLSEPDRQTELPWFFDAPWETANCRDHHKFLIRGTDDARGRATAFYGLSVLARCGGEMLRQVLYGDSRANPDEMMGLTPQFIRIGGAQNAVNVLDAGGVEPGLCSVWLIGWGPRTVFMASPDGAPPSLGGECCVVVADWRYVARIANINATDPMLDILSLFSLAALQLPAMRRDVQLRPIFYVNEDVDKRLADVGRSLAVSAGLAANLSSFRNVPIRVVRELRGDEARV